MKATVGDIPRLVEMGRKFHAASNVLAPFGAEAVSGMLEKMIAAESAVVLATGGGAIGGVLSPAYCTDQWVMAVELFWWSEDRTGLKLLAGFEAWAKENNADEVRMTTLINLPAADKILRHKGYLPLEVSYGKATKWQ